MEDVFTNQYTVQKGIEYNIPCSEDKLSSEERDKLDSSQFGIPELRKYPLNDKNHVKQAVVMFNYVDKEHEEELAKNILKVAKKFNMEIHVSRKNRMNKYMNTRKVIEAFDSFHVRSGKFISPVRSGNEGIPYREFYVVYRYNPNNRRKEFKKSRNVWDIIWDRNYEGLLIYKTGKEAKEFAKRDSYPGSSDKFGYMKADMDTNNNLVILKDYGVYDIENDKFIKTKSMNESVNEKINEKKQMNEYHVSFIIVHRDDSVSRYNEKIPAYSEKQLFTYIKKKYCRSRSDLIRDFHVISCKEPIEKVDSLEDEYHEMSLF